MPHRSRILLVTDLAYRARGRRYGDEDILLASRLRTQFDLALCHPLEAASLMDAFDAVMIRNSGPVLHYREAYDAFRVQASRRHVRVYNPLSGRGDMAGKKYLLELSDAGYPVIPTIDRLEHLDRLPRTNRYAVKPMDGADSIGLEFLPREQLTGSGDSAVLIQPYVDFRYEVSFYFVDNAFQYALYAPFAGQRWALEHYAPSGSDLDFACSFIAWNNLDYGIQRVDACRTQAGDLLLVELEDLNPYLSLERVSGHTREMFIDAVTASLHRALGR